MAIHGICDARYAEVQDEFERNFEERGEVGASVCVTVDGETVVDLWGGTADPVTGAEWRQDTIGHVWSCTKGATALCAHILASRGDLDLNVPVVKYWPEFAAKGKDAILVRHLLTHTAGLPALREPLPDGAFYDFAAMAGRLADEEPFWEPGTRQGYHALTFGFLVGEVIRRVGGRTLGTFFRDEVAGPLGLDFWIGLPQEYEERVAPTIPAPPPAPGAPMPTLYRNAFGDPSSIAALVIGNTGGYLTPGESDSRAAHAAEMGAVGAITNGRGLAGMYRPLALGGGLVSPDQTAVMASVAAATQSDAVLSVPTRWAMGFVKGTDNGHLRGPDAEGVLLSEDAFGHSGMGGSLGFADPVPRLSFGYSMNLQGPGLGVNERGQALMNAVYRTLGYRQAYGGLWYL
ncbi:class A beta-lactamase-related serine hydrolase [Sphaerisporangium album]|uniref:Class A beta-lactamase-related serine hydrolase n=1 Tax=Sphaerisporangium album TaxID=509200 RepID=A0A367FLB7_9ACTN|nr:serine hydrolase domain-containing protein [Sphaerisporangium album]RCG31051.1 class A beta-lactamase-related serine hydrolase [Sphaerisporangium album]